MGGKGEKRTGVQNPFISLLTCQVLLHLMASVSEVWAPSPGNMHHCTQHTQEKFFNQGPFTQVGGEGERNGFLPESRWATHFQRDF